MHGTSIRRIPIFFRSKRDINTFIRQSGRNRQRNTDIYKEIQLNIKQGGEICKVKSFEVTPQRLVR